MSVVTFGDAVSVLATDAPEPSCASCGSTALVKSGHNSARTQQFLCKECGAHRVLKARSRATAPELKARVLQAVEVEGLSLRQAEHRFGVTRQSIARWLKSAHVTRSQEREVAVGAYTPF